MKILENSYFLLKFPRDRGLMQFVKKKLYTFAYPNKFLNHKLFQLFR